MGFVRRLAKKSLLVLGIPQKLQQLLDLNDALPAFAGSPKDLRIRRPWAIANPERIRFGDGVRLDSGCLLALITEYPGKYLGGAATMEEHQAFDPKLTIGDRVIAGRFLQIFAQAEVRIGNDVMLANNVYINDASHSYSSCEIPFKDQPLWKVAPVRIGQGCWIGQNVVILPGVEIGEFSIVGANSVVKDSVPARSIVAGSPARIIKRWDAGFGGWVSISRT